MKKLFLSLLLAWPIVGFAGGDAGCFSYQVGKKYPVYGIKCEIIKEHLNPGFDKSSQTLVCRRVLVRGILYRDYEVLIPDLNNLDNPPRIMNAWVTVSNKTKYTVLGAALTGAAYYGASVYFPEQLAKLKEFLSTQKDNFLDAISPLTKPITETISPVFNTIGENATAGLNSISGRINSLFATKK